MNDGLEHYQGVGAIMHFYVVVEQFALDSLEPGWDSPCAPHELMIEYADFIHRAVVAGELPHFTNGKVVTGGEIVAKNKLLLRRADLRKWLCEHYPNLKPSFLFDKFEQNKHSTISLDEYTVAITQRDEAIKQNNELNKALASVNKKLNQLQKAELHPRRETTLLNTIFVIGDKLIGDEKVFPTEAQFIDVVLSEVCDIDVAGLKKSTLEKTFKDARESIFETDYRLITK